MKPGRELDALMAEKVMGLIRITDDDWKRAHGYTKDHNDRFATDCMYRSSIRVFRKDKANEFFTLPRPYSTDIAAAWEVVEKLISNAFAFELDYSFHDIESDDFYWMALFSKYKGNQKWGNLAESTPHAICLAALKAVHCE